MASKARKAVRKSKSVKPAVVSAEPVREEWSLAFGRKLHVLVIILLLVLFWKNTNSWPVAAIVNYQPVWAWELNDLMYDQVGQQALDNLITQRLIADKLAAENINISESEVDARIAEIKEQIGSDEAFEQALTFQGMTKESLREQIKLQAGLELLVEPSTDSAQMSDNVYELVQKLRGEGKVWIMPRTVSN